MKKLDEKQLLQLKQLKITATSFAKSQIVTDKIAIELLQILSTLDFGPKILKQVLVEAGIKNPYPTRLVTLAKCETINRYIDLIMGGKHTFDSAYKSYSRYNFKLRPVKKGDELYIHQLNMLLGQACLIMKKLKHARYNYEGNKRYHIKITQRTHNEFRDTGVSRFY